VISTNQFKNGTHIDVDGTVFRIVEFQHVKPGKGGAFVRSKLKRVDDGAVIDKTFKAGEKFRPVRTETRKMQFLYDSGDAAVFMDNQSYDQVEIPKSIVGDALRWVPPNSDVDLLFVDERPAGAQPPSAVDLAITQTDPGLKGDTASGGGTKPATLETGVTVQVPLFIEEGERVRVDTRTGEYVSRAYEVTGRPLGELLEGTKPFSRELAESVEANRPELDALISTHSKGWALARIAPLERSILRTALYEALHSDDVPVEVAIDEAVELAKEYCGADAPGFVNGILGAALEERGAVD
jgi:elongation factor P